MFLRRFYDEPLAQASYLVGCQATGEALVLDPIRDVGPYLEVAQGEGLRITHVAETHIHADFVSGVRELAHGPGARPHLSGEGGEDWSYAFAEEDGAVLLRDGDRFMVGNLRFDVLHTPGHTPEHLTFLVTDTAGADRPMGAFTGDFLFVGDVGRPDLLERAARIRDTMEPGARQLFRSLQRFKQLDDWIQIWPGHGAGSACGKGLGAVPSSTLGYERLFNWAFSHEEEGPFVEAVLQGQPEPPTYFARMKAVNRDGPPVAGGVPVPGAPGDDALAGALEAGAFVVDTRPWPAFAGGHVPGTLNLPLDRNFTTSAGWLLPADRDLFLVVDGAHGARVAARHLWVIGFDRVRGAFDTSAVAAWARAGNRLETVGRITPGELADRLAVGGAAVVDVRWRSEWEAGRIPGAVHLPMGELEGRLDELPPGRPLILQCATGRRSAIAASLLRLHGIRDVLNLDGGFEAWSGEGRAVERPEAAPAAPP